MLEPLRWGQTGSTNFDYVDHVSDSVDVLASLAASALEYHSDSVLD